MILLIAPNLLAQSNYLIRTVKDTIPINFENEYQLSAVSIVPESEVIKLKNRTLVEGEYNFFYMQGKFNLSDTLSYSIFDTLYVKYRAVNLGLQKVYKRRNLVKVEDERYSDSIRVIKREEKALTTESIFGKGIRQSGSILRGFTVGTNQDLTVNSGLRLQLSGKLSEDIEVVAALTDENTPIQPEGNTETLEELDKVFIEIKHPNAVGTFGDYDYNQRIGEFGQINRKLQGLKGEFKYGNNQAGFAVASSRGKFNTNQFFGQDGVQGPYRLSGINNEKDIIVIAGSETVYLDGEKMKRGENNDYVIEYANAELTFTTNRLITSASRITVDFEYTDRQYQRNFFGVNGKSKLLDDKLNLSFNYFREGDDQNSPIDLSFADKEKEVLQTAGDDRNEAVISGVEKAQEDSTGKIRGTYIKVDTTIAGEDFSYYVYNPGNDSALYNVQFSFVGAGEGDYEKLGLGKYRFVGRGKGGYLPVRFLPLPQLKQTGNVMIEASPWEVLNVNLELAGSIWDRNRFSSIDDDNNTGYARNLLVNLKDTEVNIGEVSLGEVGLSVKDRYIEKRFTSLDRVNTVEFDRDYNVTGGSNDDEVLREFNLRLKPIEQLKINSQYGYLRRGSRFNSDRYLAKINLSGNENYNANYNFDYVSTENNALLSDWYKQNGKADYTLFNHFQPSVSYLSEYKSLKRRNSDSLFNDSHKYFEIGPFFRLFDIYGFALNANYSYREEEFPLYGIMSKQSDAFTQKYSLEYKGIREVNSKLDFTYRKKKYTDSFKGRGYLDNETILIRSETRLNLWKRLMEGNIFYEVATERTAKLEKVFVKVAQGTGNYKYIGDLNNNGVADENEFEQTLYNGDYIRTTIPTDELFPVINLKSSARWKLNFDKAFNGNDFLSNMMKPLSTETFVRVEEKSRETQLSRIYLMDLPHFLNDSTTIKGSNYFQQDIHIFENSSELSFRFRYTQRNSLNQYNTGLQRTYFRERSMRVRFRMIEEITNQTEFTNEIDNVSAPETSNQSRLVENNELVTDFSYRPINNLEVGFEIKVGETTDNYPETPTIIDVNGQTLRLTWSLANRGRLRVEVERNELIANVSTNYIPFEVTKGNSLGKNYFWRVNFDFRISGNLQSRVSYDGRMQGGGRTIHSMRAEARAYF